MRLLKELNQALSAGENVVVLTVGPSEEGYIMSSVETGDAYDKSTIDKIIRRNDPISLEEGMVRIGEHFRNLESSTPKRDERQLGRATKEFYLETKDRPGTYHLGYLGHAFHFGRNLNPKETMRSEALLVFAGSGDHLLA